MKAKKEGTEETCNAWVKTVREAFAQEAEDCINPKRMDRYVSEDLSDGEAKEIALHMAFCGHCRRQYIRSALRAQADKGIVGLQTLREGAAEGIAEAQKILADRIKWVQDLVRPFELQPVRVRAAVRTRGAKSRPLTKEAKVLDAAGKPTAKTVTFSIREGPKIEGGKFILTLETSETEYEGHIAHVALKKEGTRLELCSAPIEKTEAPKGLVVEAFADLGEIELKSAPVPLELLEITVQRGEAK